MARPDPFAALEQPRKKKSFLSSLLTTKDSSKEALTEVVDSKANYRSPFRTGNSTKRPRVYDNLQENYVAPDLQKKSRTPKTFTPGTKLTQNLRAKPSRRFSFKSFFKSSSAAVKKPEPIVEEKEAEKVKNVKEEVPKKALEEVSVTKENSAAEEKEVASERAKVVAETEKQLTGVSESADDAAIADGTKEPTPSLEALRKEEVPTTKEAEKVAEKVVNGDVEHAKDSEVKSQVTERPVEDVASEVAIDSTEKSQVLEQEPETAKEEIATPQIEEVTESAKTLPDSSSVANDSAVQSETEASNVTEEEQHLKANREVSIIDGAIIADDKDEAVKEISELADEPNEKENADTEKTAEILESKKEEKISDQQEIDVGAGLTVKQGDVLATAKENVSPVLKTLDINAREQQKTDAEYLELRKKEHQEKNEKKVQKLKEKNEQKYTEKEQKFNYKIENLKSKTAELESKIEQAKEKHSKELEESKKAHEESLLKEEERFKKDKEFLIAEHKNLKLKKEKELEDLIENEKKVKLKIKLLESQKTESESKSKVLAIDIGDLEEKHNDKKTELEKLQEKLSSKQAEIDELSKARSESEKVIASESSKQVDLDKVIQSTSSEIAAAQTAIKEYEEQLSKLKKESEERKGLYGSLKKNLEEQKAYEKQLDEAHLLKKKEMDAMNSSPDAEPEVVEKVESKQALPVGEADKNLPAKPFADSSAEVKKPEVEKLEAKEPKVEKSEAENSVAEEPKFEEKNKKDVTDEGTEPDSSSKSITESSSKSITEFPITVPKSSVTEEEPTSPFDKEAEIDTVLENSEDTAVGKDEEISKDAGNEANGKAGLEASSTAVDEIPSPKDTPKPKKKANKNKKKKNKRK